MTLRFVLDDGVTTLTVSNGPPAPSLTVEGPPGTEKVVTYGILEDSAFVYANGARMHWDDTHAWWTGKALMVGETAARVHSPLH